MEKKTKKLQGWLVLFIISVVAGIGLATTNELTKDAIVQRALEGANAARAAVLSQADAFEEMEVSSDSGIDNMYKGTKAGEAVGYVAQATQNGYGGPIEIMVGVDMNGALTGISVGGSNFSETAGLGAKAKEASFTNQFVGLQLPAKLKENVDAITGATITSSAVVRGVNAAGQYVASVAGFSIGGGDVPSNVVINGKTAVITKDGFAAPIEISITVDDAGAITAMSVGGEQFAETPGFGAKAKEEAFTTQFIGKSGSVTLGTDVDAISGATITSTAVVDGVNEGLTALSGAPAGPKVEGNTAVATVDGFGGPIDVIVTVDDAGAITALTVGGEQFAETPGFGAKAQEEAFTSQFIGRSGSVALGTDVDGVSGATITSTAVVKGVNEALAALSGAPVAQSTPAPEATQAPEEPTVVPAADGKSATVTVDGFAGPIDVTVTVDDKGAIASLTVGGDKFAETPGFGAKAKEEAFTSQFIGKSGSVALGTDVDAVSGATITSTAVVKGVNDALAVLSGGTDAQSTAAPEATKAPEEPIAASAADGKSATATVDGFGGPIDVTITVDDKGAITSLTVGGDKFAETPGFGAKAKEEAFTSQFIGKSGSVTLGTDVDGVSGATITSTAVVKGVNEALATLGGGAAAQSTSAPESAVAAEGRTAKATKEGFESPIEVVVTVDAAGKIVAMTVGENKSFGETEGLGTRVKEENFIKQFVGQAGPFELGKNVDGISGATFSSKAVVEAANEAIASLGTGTAEESVTEEIRTAKATKEGFESPIEVVVTVDGEGKITEMTVGENKSFGETEGLGTRVKEEDFIKQFIGQTGPFELGKNVDGISGATFSSKAVVEAANEAIASLVADSAEETRTAKATKEGFESPIEVVVTVDGAGKIVAMTVGENKSFGETEGLGTRVKEEDFIKQFIGQTGPFELGKNVDGISGATFSSKAVVEAINEALASLAEEAAEPNVASGETRTAKATKEGFESPIEVVLTLDDAGKIVAMTVGENKSFDETEGLGTRVKEENFIKQFIGKAGPFELGKNVDGISGATFSSKAVVEAANAALKSIEK